MSVQDKVIADIVAAREAAGAKGNANDDLTHSGNDWIAFITAYLGRAARGVYRNDKEGQQYRDNLVKAGGLIVSALVAYDRSHSLQNEYVTPGTVVVREKA